MTHTDRRDFLRRTTAAAVALAAPRASSAPATPTRSSTSPSSASAAAGPPTSARRRRGEHRRPLRRERAGRRPRPRASTPRPRTFTRLPQALRPRQASSTPSSSAPAEHTHAFATLPALQLGKHVYCEKPLTHNVWEARVIREAAAKAKVATQMGTQIHAGDNYRRVVELIQAGAIGPVTRGPRLGRRGPGAGSRAEDAEEARRHRLRRASGPTESSPVAARARLGPLARPGARRGRSTRSTSPGRSGTAGGTSATAR